jgi:N-acetylmuramoyl-L-alanine amidase
MAQRENGADLLDVPSILGETSFTSNAHDSQRLLTAPHQQA